MRKSSLRFNTILFSSLLLSIVGNAQIDKRINLSMKNNTLKEFFKVIESESDYTFMYQNLDVNDKFVTGNFSQIQIGEVLKQVLSQKGLKFDIKGKQILIKPQLQDVNSLKKRNDQIITGFVKDQKGEPVIGANIVIKGASDGTITDVDGGFKLKVPVGAILKISYIGYVPKEIKVTKDLNYNLILKEDTENLEEVVIVGYGTQKKVNLTGSVAAISAQEIMDVPVANLSNALSGRLAGVRITQTAGKPGGGSSVSIRSSSTWNNTEPLYVIDGIVRDKFAFDGLDASEVENLSVLKDGASAAIYGSRAANGVVLVTTKKGSKSDKPTITYNGTIGFSDATLIPKTQNGYDQAIFINDNLRNEGVDFSDSRYYSADELEYFRNNDYNWLDHAWERPLVTRHTLNVNGGNDRVRYFVGGSYYYETGSFNNLTFNKYNLRSNIETNITRNLVAAVNFSMDKRKDRKPYWEYDYDNDQMADLYKGLLFRSSGVPAYINGKPNGTYVEWHPLEVINGATGYNKKDYSNYDATVSLSYDAPFLKGLNFKVMYNLYERHTFLKQFNRPYQLYNFKTYGTNNHLISDEYESVKTRNDGDFLRERYAKDHNYQLNAFVNYNNTFGLHSVGAMFLYEQSEGTNDWFDGRRNYFISSSIDQLFAGSTDSKNSSINGSGSEDGRISYVGRLNYGYADKYLVEASFRYDGSVKFAPSERWGFFPSGSLAWRVSEEGFFKESIPWIDYLKLRGSIGLLGNDAVGGWQWMQRYKLEGGAYFGELTSGVSPNVVPNPNITWEKSLSYNVGADFMFLDSRLSLNTDFFYRHTYDILGSRIASLPTSFGANMPSENYAAIDAKGVELEVNFQDKIGELYYSLGVNFGYATNKLKIKDEPVNIRSYKSEIGYNTDRLFGYYATNIIRTQEDLDALPDGYTIFGQKPELGMLNYRDLRGVDLDSPDGKIDSNDADWIAKHTTPPMNYGVSLGSKWKGFSLNLLFQGVAGSKRAIDFRWSQARPQETNFDFWTDHWTPENVNAKFPAASRSASDELSTFWLRDASFLRLKDLTFSYSLPKGLTQKMSLSDLRVFFVGTNLCLLQNNLKYYDPENSGIRAYPLMRSFSFGVNFNF